MAHRAEQILVSLFSSLTLVITDTERARIDPVILSSGDSALSLNMGSDEIHEESSLGQYDRVLNFKVISYIKEKTGWESKANSVRAIVHKQLMTNFISNAPSFVIAIEPSGDEEPEKSGDLEIAVLQQTLNYRILYSHSLTDTEV